MNVREHLQTSVWAVGMLQRAFKNVDDEMLAVLICLGQGQGH